MLNLNDTIMAAIFESGGKIHDAFGEKRTPITDQDKDNLIALFTTEIMFMTGDIKYGEYHERQKQHAIHESYDTSQSDN